MVIYSIQPIIKSDKIELVHKLVSVEPSCIPQPGQAGAWLKSRSLRTPALVIWAGKKITDFHSYGDDVEVLRNQASHEAKAMAEMITGRLVQFASLFKNRMHDDQQIWAVGQF